MLSLFSLEDLPLEAHKVFAFRNLKESNSLLWSTGPSRIQSTALAGNCAPADFEFLANAACLRKLRMISR
jgi:hypothetical protein